MHDKNTFTCTETRYLPLYKSIQRDCISFSCLSCRSNLTTDVFLVYLTGLFDCADQRQSIARAIWIYKEQSALELLSRDVISYTYRSAQHPMKFNTHYADEWRRAVEITCYRFNDAKFTRLLLVLPPCECRRRSYKSVFDKVRKRCLINRC